MDTKRAVMTVSCPPLSPGPSVVMQGDSITPAILISLQQAETAGRPYEEASPSLRRPAAWVPTSPHPAPVRVHLTLLPPPGQQPEDVSKDWEVEWACTVLHP